MSREFQPMDHPAAAARTCGLEQHRLARTRSFGEKLWQAQQALHKSVGSSPLATLSVIAVELETARTLARRPNPAP